MASSSQIPASELIRRGVGIGDVQEGRKTKDEYRKQKVYFYFYMDISSDTNH
uniref:Uncharacterized protein n=1 Tax=Ascaris lumbricoides TaxID=6252 RepID=A0A0M3HM32_ASCLU